MIDKKLIKINDTSKTLSILNNIYIGYIFYIDRILYRYCIKYIFYRIFLVYKKYAAY